MLVTFRAKNIVTFCVKSCYISGQKLLHFGLMSHFASIVTFCGVTAHMYASCWGLRCFLCSTLVTCWLFHFYIISNVRKLFKNIRFFLITNKNLKSLCPFCTWSHRQQKLTSRCSKGHGSWFWNWWISIRLVVSVFQWRFVVF